MRRLPILAAVACLAACSSVRSTVIMDRSGTPFPPAGVHVFTADEDPDASCERVAFLYVSSDPDFSDEGEIVSKLKEETGKLGGNAVLPKDVANRRWATQFDDGEAEALRSGLSLDGLALWCLALPTGRNRGDSTSH